MTEEATFERLYLGRWEVSPPPPKVGDFAFHISTGYRSVIVMVEPRVSDDRFYCILAGGRKCVLPDDKWEFLTTE